MLTNHWSKQNNPLFDIGDVVTVMQCKGEQLSGCVIRYRWLITSLDTDSNGNWEYLLQFSLLPENWYSEDSLQLPDITQQIYRWTRRWCSCLDQAEGTEALIAIAGLTRCLGQEVPISLNDEHQRQVVLWLNLNHPQAYLWAIGQTN